VNTIKRVIHLSASTALLFSLWSVTAWAGPAMSVLTVNGKDPAGYMKWVQQSGPAIAESIDAAVGGVCLPSAGYYGPGELYYWHLFNDHATALGSEQYNPTVMAELKKLKGKRIVSRGDAYSVLLAEPGDYKAGDTFANWNLIISTDEPAQYLKEVARLSATADDNGFADIRFTVYRYLSGENAGKLMASIQAPDGNRLGAMLDALESDWASEILNDMADIRQYEHGFTMNCRVVFAASS
jgi:hypothetical protein